MDREIIEVVIEMFIDSLVPYLQIVNSWFISSDFEYETNDLELPRFLKPYMKEILSIRKSLMVIQIVKEDLLLKAEISTPVFQQEQSW